MTAMVGINVSGLQVRHDFQGLFEVFGGESELDKTRRCFPEIGVNGRYSRLFKTSDNSLLNEVGPDSPLTPVSWDGPARLGSQGFDTWTLQTAAYRYGHVIIPDTDAAEAASMGVNAEFAWSEKYIPQGAAARLRIIGQQLANNSNYDSSMRSTSLALTAESVDYQSFLLAAKRAFLNNGVPSTGLIIVMNDVVADRLLTINQVFDGPGVAGVADSGATLNRLGMVNRPALEAFHRAMGFGETVVFETRTIRSTGAAPALEDDIYILHAQGGMRRSFVKVGNHSDSLGGPMVVRQYPNYNPGGVAMYMEDQWGIGLPSTFLGYRLEGVLS